MTPSITAWPPMSVSSPLSRMGSIWRCAERRRNLAMDKVNSLSNYNPDCAHTPQTSNTAGMIRRRVRNARFAFRTRRILGFNRFAIRI